MLWRATSLRRGAWKKVVVKVLACWNGWQTFADYLIEHKGGSSWKYEVVRVLEEHGRVSGEPGGESHYNQEPIEMLNFH